MLGRGMMPFLGSSIVRVVSEALEEERRVGDSGRYQAWLELRLLLGTSRVATMHVCSVYANVMRVGDSTSDVHRACSRLVYSRCCVGHRDLYPLTCVMTCVGLWERECRAGSDHGS
jgi:hypothetical protein